MQPNDEREEWGLHAGCTLASCFRALGLVALLVALSAAGGAYLMWPQAFEKGRENGRAAEFDRAFAAGQEMARTEIREACQCWFTDSRCKADNVIVACRALGWMKE